MPYFFFFALAFFVFFAFAFFAFLAIVSSSFAGRPLWRGRAAPPCNTNRLIRLGLSAKEPMILVDKRLDKATAPRLLWVLAVSKRFATQAGLGGVATRAASDFDYARIAAISGRMLMMFITLVRL
jgi:hypothetical protein